MEGKHPRTGRWLRDAGSNGARGGGIDLTFSAPKSVSAVWALADESQRREIEAAHAAAVNETIAHLTDTVPTVRRRSHGQVFEEPARDVVAAEYRHTTARGVLETDAPDPQLHSHVVITSAVRDDGKIVAVASRPIFRSARELGAYYRSSLAHQLQQRGYAIERGTGKHGRYFEIAGVPRGLLDAFSSRSREVARAAERFRAKWGRAPERGELRQLKLENRKAKVLITRADLQQAWNDTAARFDFAAEQSPGRPLGATVAPPPDRPLEDRVEQRLAALISTPAPTPIQLIRPATWGGSVGTEDPATTAWNLFSALFYKAGGKPWRLQTSRTEPTRCFVGISFARLADGQLFASVAQVFNELRRRRHRPRCARRTQRARPTSTPLERRRAEPAERRA